MDSNKTTRPVEVYSEVLRPPHNHNPVEGCLEVLRQPPRNPNPVEVYSEALQPRRNPNLEGYLEALRQPPRNPNPVVCLAEHQVLGLVLLEVVFSVVAAPLRLSPNLLLGLLEARQRLVVDLVVGFCEWH